MKACHPGWTSVTLPVHDYEDIEMQLSNYEKQKIDIWEQLRTIEGELFLLTARSGELDSENRSRIGCLCDERTHLASQLLLCELR
jgi:hypothetical protein